MVLIKLILRLIKDNCSDFQWKYYLLHAKDFAIISFYNFTKVELMFHVKCYWIIRNMVIIYLIILNAILKTVSLKN